MNKLNEFVNQFNICIDKKGKPKACGRDNCMKLIMIANEIDPNTDYGNKHSFMNVENLIVLHNNILKLT